MTAATDWSYERPHRVLGMRVFNAVGRTLRKCGLKRPLSADRILARARRSVGEGTFDGDPAGPVLAKLVESLEADAHLSPAGRGMVALSLAHHAANRLKLRAAVAADPGILAQPVRPAVVVVGLPRTGTTLLHNLLAQDPASRPLLFWEAIDPVRPAQTRPDRPDPRVRRARHFLRFMVHLAGPQLQVVHPMSAEGPEEDTFLLMNSFVVPAFFGNIQSLHISAGPARSPELWTKVYEEFRTQLQVLQAQRPTGHWALKSPVHMAGLGPLLDVFPDAVVVMTHRDPAQVVPSTCSLFAVSQAMFSDDLDPRALGPVVADILRDLLEVSAEGRARHPGRVCDVHFNDLVADPVGTVRDIYRFMGREVGDAMEAGMRKWLAANPANKHGTHKYTLEQFGLTPTDIDGRFADYRAYLAGIGRRPSGGR